ncbi:bifunctional purine biosynthesis protein PurH-like isoform X1 [Zingiber officinale]|uniref:bifunctional purine biosynthesis protein PurH-like isoform X1 n=1 Tax=Zingiber officinale TaxID=94328 RepID=UPI001C4BBA26|nr:bifunctional purine biosynthesis protein PurH-like isoform X1 [Zingiber officinale]
MNSLYHSPAPVTASVTNATALSARCFIYCHRRRLKHAVQDHILPSFVARPLSPVMSGVVRVRAQMETEVSSSLSCGGQKRALISLSNKRDLAFLGRGLQGLGYAIVSTGGTSSALEEAGISVTKVEEITHFPEMLDGCATTLQLKIHGGILACRDHSDHMDSLSRHGIGTFDILVVNLYNFEDGIENINSDGHTLICDAVKNHTNALVVVDHDDYPAVLDFLKGKQDDQNFRDKLALKAFRHVASYESAILEWRWKQTENGYKFPPSLMMPLSLKSSLRCGENPHQKAALYIDKSISLANAGGIANAIQHHGKEMSYNNYLDAEAAWNCVSEFKNPTCVTVKHTNPCGVASRQDILEAYRLAVKADPVSAYGSIVAFNTTMNEDLAKELREYMNPINTAKSMFYEIVVAPGYTEKGLEILKGKSKDLRILEVKKSEKGVVSFRRISGGWLVQESDDLTPDDIKFSVMSERVPEETELHDAEFAWLCVKHVKSNAIVIAKNNCMLGMGSGQPNRRESLRIAFRKAGEAAKGAALASDAFFPFALNDAVEEACKNGIGVIAQPGGSKRDGEAVDCCNKYGVSLLFTGVRHFRH